MSRICYHIEVFVFWAGGHILQINWIEFVIKQSNTYFPNGYTGNIERETVAHLLKCYLPYTLNVVEELLDVSTYPF